MNLVLDDGIDLLLCCRWLCRRDISLLIRGEAWSLNAEQISYHSFNYWALTDHPEAIGVHKLTIVVRAMKMLFNLMLPDLSLRHSSISAELTLRCISMPMLFKIHMLMTIILVLEAVTTGIALEC